jgi:outer membrane protein TolC
MKEEYLAVRDDVIFRTKEAYYNILKAAGFVDVAKENLEIAEANSKIARDLFEAGAAAKFDVLRTEVSLEQARQGIIIAQNNLALAKKAFATVLNIDINTPFEVEWLKEIPCADLKLADGEKKSLADRPELRQLGMIVEMGKTLVEAARRGKNPTISLLSTYDKKNQSGFSSQDYQWTTSLALNVPIFDQGVTAARVKQAAGSLEQMQGTYDNARRQVILEVHQAWTQQAEAFQRIGVARKQVESAEEACRVGELRYREGVSIITEVLDTQAALVAARISYINSLHDYALNLAKWEQATGSTRYFK